MGGEAVSVAQKAYLVAWFASDELNLVFGFIASSALLVTPQHSSLAFYSRLNLCSKQKKNIFQGLISQSAANGAHLSASKRVLRRPRVSGRRHTGRIDNDSILDALRSAAQSAGQEANAFPQEATTCSLACANYRRRERRPTRGWQRGRRKQPPADNNHS